MMNAKRQRLIGGQGGRRLPSLEAKLYHGATECAAPYLKHVGLAAPYLADSIPDLLPGLLLPSMASLKPPAARKAPTRTNLFKASKTLSTNEACNACPIVDGTIVVFHFGTTPPTAYLCLASSRTKLHPGEYLTPYYTIDYQVDANSQFTLATNAAASISFEITSFAAANPLNGQMTIAHVMDIDDIQVYSSGSYELNSTTPKDALSSTSLAKGIIGIMGPESFSTVLYHPDHPARFPYPGWSLTYESDTVADDDITWILQDSTSHRWFVNTTFEITVDVSIKGAAGDSYLYLQAIVYEAKCPKPSVTACTTSGTEQKLYNIACLPVANQAKSAATTADESWQIVNANTPPKGTCYNLSAVFSTTKKQNLVGFIVNYDRSVTTAPEIKSARFHLKTCVQNPEAQFGPAIIGRFEGITKDIVVQANIRAAISGIQSGTARAVAPPTTPSNLALGEEDTVLAQAAFDDPTAPLARVMTTSQYKEAGANLGGLTRENNVQRLEAAPIGDTIRGIGSTISRIGHSLGGPFGTLGDIVGTVGNIAGGIGDAIGGIFSAPAGMDVLMAAPDDRNRIITQQIQFLIEQNPSTPTGPTTTPASIRDSLYKTGGWSVGLNNMTRGKDFKVTLPDGSIGTPDRMQPFPWVSAADGSSGISNLYITSLPLSLADRPSVRYYTITMPNTTPGLQQRCYIDERLVSNNTQAYVSEIVFVVDHYNIWGKFISTDAAQFIYGDSMSAALANACMFPTLQACVSGGVAAAAANQMAIRPVGLINSKAQAALDAGLILICPYEPPTLDLRNTTGTSVVTMDDIMLGLLTESPKIIIVNSALELFMATMFLESSKSIPIGPEEEREKEKLVTQAKEKGEATIEARRLWVPPPGATPEEIRAIRAKTVELEIPGLGMFNEPLFDISWWEQRRADLERPAAQKGIGSSLAKVRAYIEDGNVQRLSGLAKSLITREQSQMKRGKSVSKRSGSAQSRLPPYKRPAQGQIKNLIDRIKAARTEAAMQQPPPPTVAPPEQPPLPEFPPEPEDEDWHDMETAAPYMRPTRWDQRRRR